MESLLQKDGGGRAIVVAISLRALEFPSFVVYLFVSSPWGLKASCWPRLKFWVFPSSESGERRWLLKMGVVVGGWVSAEESKGVESREGIKG